ncbi:MAG: orotidine-5'-phosphate decarboxylase [Pyrinomonadaceae bacterium]
MSEIQNPKSKIQNPLIVALDVPTASEARVIFDELRETGCAFKIGMQLFTAAGSQFVRELIEEGAKIFLDLKFHDIPNTVANAGVEAARLGVWMFNVHALGGREMMERTVLAVRETAVKENLPSPKIIAVTVLTSSNRENLREVGIESEPLEQVLKLAKMASDCNLDGVVASPQEASRIKTENKQRKINNEKSNNFFIVTPGIRFESKIQNPKPKIESDDQKRTLSPFDAIKAGADYLVVGRPILQAADKRKATQDILAEITSANE